MVCVEGEGSKRGEGRMDYEVFWLSNVLGAEIANERELLVLRY